MTVSTTCSTANSALILVDVLNDFLAENGKLAGMIGPMIEKLELRRNLQHLLDGVRKAGLKTVYAPMVPTATASTAFHTYIRDFTMASTTRCSDRELWRRFLCASQAS